jgi:hypothetical protein
MKLFHLLSAGMILSSAALAGTASFEFDPFGGNLSGTPGSTVGWGFTISDSVDYVLLDNTGFCGPGISNSADIPCSNGPDGTYTDFTSSNFVVVGPSPETTPLTENFSASLMTGYGSFTINNTTPVGTVITDDLYVVYDLYSGDPASGGTLESSGNLASLSASITVESDSPEPGTMLPAGLAIASLLLWRIRRSGTSTA